MESSQIIKKYFKDINDKVSTSYAIAQEAREKGLDPEKEVPIPLAQNMSERVVGLISVIYPQILNKGIPTRIQELEKEYGMLDWRVGFKISEEVAKEKFCKFEDIREAMEAGIRVGFAYLTLGIVSAPLEGFIGLKIKKRKDGQEYLALQYAGPIRAAGGTAASTSVILSDYVRVKMGYAPYDPDEKEVNRYTAEVHDYHDRVTNLQYHPSDEELKFMVSHLPVEVDGDPTERMEVSNYKDLPRIETNLIRGGVALVLAEGLSQKSPKLWKRLSKWGKEFELEWEWLQEFIELKEKIHASHSDDKKEDSKSVKANNTFIMDIVAGRPVLTHPLAVGGFRLRYGRTRATGFSAAALHPATLIVLDKFIAVGTQLKVERPGKACTITLCDSINGPIVRLEDGSVLYLHSEEEAKQVASKVEEILFLGDILFNYGDFSENGHRLVPAGYCAEWWILELEKAGGSWEDLTKIPSFEEVVELSEKHKIPLHPAFTFYWKLISGEELKELLVWLKLGKIKKDKEKISKIILPLFKEVTIHTIGKKLLEHLGVIHAVVNKESVIIEGETAQAIYYTLNSFDLGCDFETALDCINKHIVVRDLAGTFIGARMGRPEKAKMRKMTGSPQMMFPIGDEGDRLRSVQAALKAGKVTSSFPTFFCAKCEKGTIYQKCETCGNECIQHYSCRFCGDLSQETCRHGKGRTFKTQEINIKHYFENAKKLLGEKLHPDLIKGIRGTSNKDHLVEHLAKGILRAKHSIYVNKDGTTRYDCTELPLTHFKPKEVQTSVEKLKEIGYDVDMYGKELVEDNQVLEMKPQDIILPGFGSLDESGPVVLKRVADFIDELLVKFYGMKPFYNIKKLEDLVGHLIVGLAPHISAGLVGRIIGFSETQGLITHPMYHAGLRRDCFGYDTFISLKTSQGWKIEKIGKIVEKLNPQEVIDNFGTKEIQVRRIETLGNNSITKVNNFTKHAPQKFIKIETQLGRTLHLTYNHKQIIFNDNKKQVKPAYNLKVGDNLGIPYKIKIRANDIKELYLFDYLKDEDWVTVRKLNELLPTVKIYAKKYFSKREYDNYTSRDSYPIKFVQYLILNGHLKQEDSFFLSAKRDTIKIPNRIPINEDFLKIIGLYVAEGYSRKVDKKLYQMYIAAENEDVRQFVSKTMLYIFGLKTTENKKDRLTYSSRILYYLFTQILHCGSSAYEKRFPSMFLDLPLQKIGHILSGYFEGDGSVSKSELRVTFDTVSEGLLRDMDFLCGRMGVFVKNYTYTSYPGQKLKDFYIRKDREIPQFTSTKGIIQSVFVKKFAKYVGFISQRKKDIFHIVKQKKAVRINQKYDEKYVYDTVKSIELLENKVSYCLNVEGNEVSANSILTKQCDGDEAGIMLLMDALLNFSRKYLPERRGAKTMDAPLVLTSVLNPTEVDDQVHGMDVAWKYPLELYEAALEMKNPWDVKIEQLANRLETVKQFEDFGYTHRIDNFNKGVCCSAYKLLPSMREKLFGQMDIAQKVRAVDMDDVARLVIERHFLRDIKGNFRKFSMQGFRCVTCNAKYRRPPLSSKCHCGGKLLFTISEGSVIKYLGPSLELAERYAFSPYLKQTLDMLRINVDAVFGKKDKQVGLGEFFA